MKWKDVPMPKNIEMLPKDARGYPVPVNILRDKQGVPNFRLNNEAKTMELATQGLCGICGNKLFEDKWLVGGPDSALHPHGAFNDPPMHYECVTYALRVCPYMLYTSYTNFMDEKKIDPKKFGQQGFHNPTQTRERLQFFVLVQIRTFEIRMYQDTHERFIMPAVPYVMIEFWREGHVITQQEVYQLMKKQYGTKSN